MLYLNMVKNYQFNKMDLFIYFRIKEKLNINLIINLLKKIV